MMDDFAAMNEAYDEFFVGDTKPVSLAVALASCRKAAKPADRNTDLHRSQCRTCVAVKQLPFNTDVEIECTAYVEQAASHGMR